MIFKQRLRVRRSELVRREAETGVSWQEELTKPWGGEERAQELRGRPGVQMSWAQGLEPEPESEAGAARGPCCGRVCI